MPQDLLKDSQDLEHGRLVDVPTHSHMSPVFLDELEVDALSQDLLEDTSRSVQWGVIARTKITSLFYTSARTYKNNIALPP